MDAVIEQKVRTVVNGCGDELIVKEIHIERLIADGLVVERHADNALVVHASSLEYIKECVAIWEKR